MRRAMSPVVRPFVVMAAAVALLVPAGATAASAAAPASAQCTAIDAPQAMNDLPATADCNVGTPTGGVRSNAVHALAAAVTPTTTIQGTPLPFDRTNGDILAITKIDGTNNLAFGGNFTQVFTPDGVSHAATDFAIVDEATGAVLYGGNPTNTSSSSDKYVRSIATFNGIVYVGGDFNRWDGVARAHTARLAPTGNPAPSAYAVTSWNPSPGSMVRGLAVDSNAVYLGVGGSAVLAVNPTSGATMWSKSVSGGDIHTVFLDQGALFVGGLFETYSGVTQHGLVKVQPTDGSLVTAFNAHLRGDTGAGKYGSYDGEEIIAIAAAPDPNEIFVGSGGHAPAGLSSNEAILLDINTGARLWRFGTTGDTQAIGAVGDTAVAGYHNNGPNAGNPLSPNYFGVQLEDSTGAATTWDPQLNGNQGNADGGNNGIQAIYVDHTTNVIYIAGAFLHWNGTTGSTHQSLIAFSFGTAAPSAPGAPTGVSAIAGNASATVTWTAPAANGSPITGYTVTSNPDGVTQLAPAGATSATVSGLTNGTGYTFTVVATNGVGPGPASAPSAQVTPTAPTAPDAPTGVSAIAGNASATVSWTAPAANGSPITGYTVTSNPDGVTQLAPAGATSATVSGLTNGTAYTFTVVATNGVGPGPASAPSAQVTPTAPTAPDAPTGVSAIAGNASATVSWTAPAANGSPITGYTVTSNPDGVTQLAPAGATSATVSGLTNGTAYTFTVVATNGVGPGPASAPSAQVTPTAPASGLANTAEGGTAGTTVTIANSGGGSGNPFTVVSRGSGAALTFSTATAAHGSLAYAITGSSGTATFVGWNGFSATSMAVRFYYNPGSSLPSKVLRLADIRNSSATAARVELSASNQLFIQNSAGTTVTTFAHPLQANTWYRIELTMSVSTSAATINAAYYPADSTTPVDPAFATSSGNTGSANITQVSFGSPASATWTGTSLFDNLAAQAATTSFIGPG